MDSSPRGYKALSPAEHANKQVSECNSTECETRHRLPVGPEYRRTGCFIVQPDKTLEEGSRSLKAVCGGSTSLSCWYSQGA